jgi:putative ABC transport system permease protein
MLKNYFKVALRNLFRHKAFSLINILGFALGLSVCFMLVLFLMQEQSYDRYNTNAGRIYKLIDVSNNSGAIDYRVALAITQNYPEVEKSCVLYAIPNTIGVSSGKAGYSVEGAMSVSNSFFDVFSTRFIHGNPGVPLPGLNSVILTGSTAKKIFGNENPVGKQIVLMRNFPVIVSGVIEDFPENSTIHANLVLNMENDNFKFRRDIGNSNDSSTYRYPFNVFLLLKEHSDPLQLLEKINEHPETMRPYVEKAGFIALADTYLHDHTTGSTTKRGNPSLMNLFTVIALVVLLLAIINYVNLSVARQNKRNRETGIRKTIGAGRRSIVFLFLTESVLVTCAAFTFGLLIAGAALPFFNTIVDSRLILQPLLQIPVILILLGSILVVGILAGIVPAVVFSLFNPVRILGGGMITSGKKNISRSILTVFQFSISIAFIFCIIVIQKQIGFAKNENLGFDKEQLFRFNLPFANTGSGLFVANRLRECPFVKNIAVTSGAPGDVRMHMGSGIEGKNISVACMAADSNFLATFKIDLVKGRNLLPGEYGQVCMINETAFRQFGWDHVENQRFNNGRKGGFEVIGVVKDFHTASLHQAIEPTSILFTSQFSLNSMTVRIEKGTTAQTIAYLNNVWKEAYPDYPLEYHFYDDWFDRMYAQDERFGRAISMFGFLAIAISCLGILGLVIFSSERRAKEIGIRKVHGASVRDVVLLLNKEFLKWVVVAFVVACPFGWYAMNKWLQDFAYRTDISWWIFAASGIIALIIALCTTSWQTWRAATTNPVEVLRSE